MKPKHNVHNVKSAPELWKILTRLRLHIWRWEALNRRL